MPSFHITKKALRQLEELDNKQYNQLAGAILRLTKNAAPHDSRPLHGASNGERRLDAGEYRIVYSVEDLVIQILLVGKRNDGEIYKQFDRMNQ